MAVSTMTEPAAFWSETRRAADRTESWAREFDVEIESLLEIAAPSGWGIRADGGEDEEEEEFSADSDEGESDFEDDDSADDDFDDDLDEFEGDDDDSGADDDDDDF